MMHKTFLASFLSFVIAARGAPTSLDTATLLQNAEEAQALNRQFQGLKAADPCKDGQVACIGAKTIAKCQGTSWETTLGQCSRSQECFALPSVSSSGTHITCTSERSAESLIAACGATGGIFGNPANGSMTVVTGSGDGSQYGSTASSTDVIKTNTPNDAPATGTGIPSPVPDSTPGPASNSNGDGKASPSRRPCSTLKNDNSPSQSTPTIISDTSPSSYTALPVSTTSVPSIPAATSAGPERVTVTVTLIPSKPATLPPTTRTMSPEEASSIIASIKAAGGSTVAPNTPACSTSVPVPASSVVDTDDNVSSTVVASPSPSTAAQESYGGY